MSTLRRFSYSAGRDRPLEASAAWAAKHDFGAVEFNADLPPNSPDQWDDSRVATFRQLRAEHRLAAGIAYERDEGGMALLVAHATEAAV